MSDEQFLDMPWDDPQEEVVAEPELEQESVGEADTDDLEDEQVEIEESLEDAETEEDEVEAESEEEDESTDDDESPEDESEDTDKIDYESEYKRLTAPFKANGKDIQVESVDDAIQLMKMGLGFSKKMAALKPNLKLMKMLENNGVLSEDKLSFLIDLDKKNPDAIKKLVSDSNLDTYEFESSENNPDYTPNTYAVDDTEIELDSVLEDIKSTTAYNTTIDVVSNKWDQTSKQEVLKNPNIIRVINEHIENGLYDQIQSVIDRDRMLGRLSGISDLEAYRVTGDRLHAEGKFTQSAPEPKPSPEPKQAVKPNPQVVKRKRAAAPTKSTPSASPNPSDFNPLSLSDEEFEKQFSAKFL